MGNKEKRKRSKRKEAEEEEEEKKELVRGRRDAAAELAMMVVCLSYLLCFSFAEKLTG